VRREREITDQATYTVGRTPEVGDGRDVRLAIPGVCRRSGSVLRTGPVWDWVSLRHASVPVASCAGLVRQLQVNNYRRKSASVTDVSVRPVWCRLAWTSLDAAAIPCAATAYRVPA